MKSWIVAALGAALVALAVGPLTAQAGPQAPLQDVADTGITVDAIVVRGNERISEDAIRAIAVLQRGQRATGTDIQTAIRRLMATGQYENVEVLYEGTPASGMTLIIQVRERPLITAFDIQGLRRVSSNTVRDTVGLKGEQPLRPQTVIRTERMVRDLLARQGVQLAGFDTTMTPVEGSPNTYVLTFNVEEGNRLAISEIRFEGNEHFSDDELRDAMKTGEEGFFWFRRGQFDRATFEEDLALNLPTFYGSNGYIDFAVVSDTMVVDPVSGKARVVISVDEGPQYRLGDFTIQGAQRFPQEQLRAMLTSERRSVLGLPFGSRDDAVRGEVFNRAALDAATARVRQLYNNVGYLYASVQPLVERGVSPNGDPVVDVTWAISEQSPFYINQVTIAGNTYTHESVIRDQLVVYPGDIYSEDRVIQSYRAITALGFFETPIPQPDIRPNPQDGTVDLVFRVVEKSTGQVQFGTTIGGGGSGGSGGLSGFIGFSQPNLFGQAKQTSVQAEYGYGRSSFTASYTDPALWGSRNSGSISLFHTDDRYRGVSFSEGRYVRTGGSLRYGVPLMGFRFTRVFAGYSLSRYVYKARNENDCEAGNIFCQPSAIASNVSLAVTRDTKDHPLFPNVGSRQNVTIQQTGGPLGGDGNFQKLTSELEWWVPVGTIGGTAPGSRPIIMTFGLAARGGAIFGDPTRFPLERFMLGGTQFGQPLRGYDEQTLTPFGYFARDDGSILSTNRLGNAYLTVTGEYALRLSDMLSISAFGDAGGIWTNPGAINTARLYRSLGIGATVITPFGPLGVDMAYGFDRTPPGWKFHFKITQPG
ncbi:MAG: outer membrane protein assembly factor BamA [Gemmatimonadota bacterium]|nr:outer membrane protein assembly factor BamA [Gemmatimonadota bacterium]